MRYLRFVVVLLRCGYTNVSYLVVGKKVVVRGHTLTLLTVLQFVQLLEALPIDEPEEREPSLYYTFSIYQILS